MFSFLHKNKPLSEIYFALMLHESGGKGYIFQCNNQLKSVIKLGSKSFNFSNSWENITEDVDELLFTLETEQKVKAKKSILFIYSHLVDLTKRTIKEPYISKIKTVFSEIDIPVSGFMEQHEAIASLMTSASGPLNAILCEVDDHALTIIVYRNGKVEFGSTIAKTTDYLEGLEKELKETSQSMTLPLHVLFYGTSEVGNDITQFIAHRWPKDIFVQLPKVEIVTDEYIENSLIAGFKKQLFTSSEDMSVKPAKETIPISSIRETKKDEPSDAENLGFLIDTDILENKEEFDANDQAPIDTTLISSYSTNSGQENPFEYGNVTTHDNKSHRMGFGNILKFKSKLSNILLVIFGALLIFGSLFSFLFYFHKAQVTLFYDTKPITKELTVTDKIIELNKSKITITKDATITTTGKKYIGTKANGEVSILNRENKAVTLSKNTKLKGPKGYIFVLDSDIKIASSSEQLTQDGNYLTVTGKEKASITAADIGEEYNLEKNTSFTIDDKPLLTATVTSTLKGGTKKEIRTVAEADLVMVRKNVINAIKNDISSRITRDGSLSVISSLTKVTVKNEKFSKELAEEGDTVSLSIKSDVDYFTLNKNDVKNKLAQIMSKSIPSDYVLDSKGISYIVSSAKSGVDGIKLVLKVKGLPKQKVDLDEIKNDLVGKSAEDMQSITQKYEAVKSESNIDSDLPFFKNRFPFFKQNLQLIIKTM